MFCKSLLVHMKLGVSVCLLLTMVFIHQFSSSSSCSSPTTFDIIITSRAHCLPTPGRGWPLHRLDIFFWVRIELIIIIIEWSPVTSSRKGRSIGIPCHHIHLSFAACCFVIRRSLLCIVDVSSSCANSSNRVHQVISLPIHLSCAKSSI